MLGVLAFAPALEGCGIGHADAQSSFLQYGRDERQPILLQLGFRFL